jgi:hypothetical protein
MGNGRPHPAAALLAERSIRSSASKTSNGSIRPYIDGLLEQQVWDPTLRLSDVKDPPRPDDHFTVSRALHGASLPRLLATVVFSKNSNPELAVHDLFRAAFPRPMQVRASCSDNQ